MFTSCYMVMWAKRKNNNNNGWLVCNSVKKHLFPACTTVFVGSSGGKSCIDTNAVWKTLFIPSLLRKESLLEGFPSVSFVADMVWCRDAFFFLSAYLNGADTKLKLIVFAFYWCEQFLEKKVVAINIIVIIYNNPQINSVYIGASAGKL